MENNPLDDQLRDLLGEYRPGDPASLQGMPADMPLDDSNELVKADDQLMSWKRIEASLDAADQAFDETVRQRIHHFQPKHDPNAWPVFLNRWNDSRHLRTKLIVMKVVESAAVLLLLFTVVHMGRVGKLPFESDLFITDPSSRENQSITSADEQFSEKFSNETASTNNNLTSKDNADAATNNDVENSISTSSLADQKLIASSNEIHRNQLSQSKSNSKFASSMNRHVVDGPFAALPATQLSGIDFDQDAKTIGFIAAPNDVYTTDLLATVDIAFNHKSIEIVPGPKFVAPIGRGITEFGILVQSDYNGLRMPEDRLYSSGQQILFPSKGILSPGFGAGFTISVGNEVWSIESGVIYSAKNFKPGRQLIVGSAFDNGSVEFEAMKLQLVTLPLHYRHHFDHTGRFKTYLMAGGGLTLIAQSDVDVRIEYSFASLSFGESPANNPDLVETMEESRRLRDHILDGAPFRTKSFVSAHAGFGFEYMLSTHKAFFFQSVLQYQIPGLQFSNNNGKHLRSVSLQAGVRGPLGK